VAFLNGKLEDLRFLTGKALIILLVTPKHHSCSLRCCSI